MHPTSRLLITSLLLMTPPTLASAACGSGQNWAGCQGYGAINKNSGEVYRAQPYHYAQPYHGGEVAPGTSVSGWRGNTGTKAFEQGCAWVNGRRECR
jgi:hypothetical protein